MPSVKRLLRLPSYLDRVRPKGSARMGDVRSTELAVGVRAGDGRNTNAPAPTPVAIKSSRIGAWRWLPPPMALTGDTGLVASSGGVRNSGMASSSTSSP